jgi:hypothetical protein
MNRIRTHAQFLAARARWEEPEDERGLQPCPECDGDCEIAGEPCVFCAGSDGEPRGYFCGDFPLSAKEYEQLAEDSYH